jgi:hypothetical protein
MLRRERQVSAGSHTSRASTVPWSCLRVSRAIGLLLTTAGLCVGSEGLPKAFWIPLRRQAAAQSMSLRLGGGQRAGG